MAITVKAAQDLVGRPADAKREFIRLIRSMAYSHSLHDVFRDFCTMARISIMQPFYRSTELEKQYMDTVGRYSWETAQEFPKLLSYVVIGLDADAVDFLGHVATELEVLPRRKGVALTPPSVAIMMAHMQFADVGKLLKKQGFVTVQEPAAGAGVMILAIAEFFKEKGHSPADTLFVDAWDVSELMASMCYIQLAMTAVPARVVWGNTLSQEIFQIWYTPMYFIKNWEAKLKS